MGSMKRAEVEEEEGDTEEESCGRTSCSQEPCWRMESLPGPWVDVALAWPAIV